MSTHSQIHHRYPTIFMDYLTQTNFVAVQDLRIESLNHETRSKYAYQATLILLLDDYNRIPVVKLDQLSIYCSNLYQVATTPSFDIV